MHRRTTVKALIFGSALVAIGCGAVDRAEPSDDLTIAMISGQPSGSEDDAVLLLRTTADGEAMCTATLVAPNLALTTRHCVAQRNHSPFQCTAEGELVPNAEGGGVLGADFPADTMFLYGAELPRTEPLAGVSTVISTITSTICKNDIAFLVLDRALELPTRAVRAQPVTQAGEPVVLVGYGATATGEKLDYQKQQRWRRDDLSVLEVGPELAEQVTGSAPPRTLRLEGPASCFGDSGGPALSAESGAVIGVFSLLSGADCSQHDVRLLYTHTGSFAALVQQAFAAAGAAPNLEPPPEDPIDAGSGDAAADAGGDLGEASSDAGGCALSKAPKSRAWLAVALVLLVLTRRSTSAKECS